MTGKGKAGKGGDQLASLLSGGMGVLPDDDDIAEPSDDELAALERELDGGDEDEEEEEDDDEEEDEADEEAAPEDLRRLLAALAGRSGKTAAPVAAPVPVAPKAALRPSPPSTQEIDDVQGALRLLEYLRDNEMIELEDGSDLEDLAPGAARILASARNPPAAASRLSKWLLAQPQVAELYADDANLEDLLARW